MTGAILTYLFGGISVAMFNYSFPDWKPALYGVSIAMLAITVFLLEYICANRKKKSKPLVKSLIAAAGFAAAFAVTVLLINNVILGSVKSTLAAYIVSGILFVFLTVYFCITVKSCGKKIFPAVLSLILVALIGLSPFAMDFIKENARPQASPKGLSQYTEKADELVMDADFYVSPDGNDNNDGSFGKPFATIQKARDAVAKLDKNGRKGITVAVKAGEYRVSSLEFTTVDSGTKECPVIYRAYGDGEAVLNGGITIDAKDFSPVDDEEMLARLSSDAQKKVLCVSLKDYGLTADDWGKIYAIGSYNTAAKYDGDYEGGIYCELFVNDKRQTLARYPDSDYLYTEKVISTGYGRESDGALTAVENWDEIRNPQSDVYGISKGLAKRIASWKTLDDVWMFGFWKYDWADASSPIGSFDEDERTLSPKFVSTYGTKTDAPYYFFNVFEELTAPGEWYLDRDSGIVYVYPDGDLSESVIDFSVTDKSIIIADNAQYLTFDGFTVKGTRGNAITLTGNDITVKNCIIKNVAGWAITADGSNILISSNEITHTGQGGITLNGGERETLTPGNNKADNNFIHDWSEIYQTYQSAVALNGVGNICSHNEIYNSPHEAITYGGNNHIIEYNDIHDVCLLTDDAGAIYAGRRWDFYGNVIRYNAVYNLGSGEHKPCGIYMDDALSGQTIYGNLLVNVPGIGLHLGGGRDLTVKNNIVINSNDRSISYDARAREGVFGGWFTHSSQKDGDMWKNLFDSPWQNDVWKKAYPQMQKFSDDFDDTDSPDFVPNPAYSEVTNNIIINIAGEIGDINEAAKKYSNTEGNFIYRLSETEKVFENAGDGDYRLKNAPDGFEQIPVEKIGRY